MESFKRNKIITFNMIILSFICNSVCSLKLTRTDPGNNVTIRWNILPTPIRHMHHFQVRNEQDETKIDCRRLFRDLINECVIQGSRITPFTVPDNVPSFVRIDVIGILIRNVSEADAGTYKIFIDTEIDDDPQKMLYVFRKPQRPIIRSISYPKVGQPTNITCSAQYQSVPNEYRNQSQMVYSWDIINPAGNHFISEDTVEIVNVTHENAGATFTCQAHELRSSLISDSSDTLTLDVYYMEDLNIYLDLSDRYLSALLCVASCNPPCIYTWFDDNLHNEIAIQDKINVSYSGQYTCMAENLVGELSGTLFVKTKDIQPEELTDQEGRSSTVTVNIPIGLGVFGIILLTVTVVLAVLYLRQRWLKNHSPGGDMTPPHNPPVYENTSFDDVGIESADIENYSSLSGEREPPQPAVYDELSHQNEQRSRAEMEPEVYENVTQGE